MDCASCSALKAKNKVCWRHIPEVVTEKDLGIKIGDILGNANIGYIWEVYGRDHITNDMIPVYLVTRHPDGAKAVIFKADVDIGRFTKEP